MNKRIGVYICQCGNNIADYVDVVRVKTAVENAVGVVLAKISMFACSDSTQKEMVDDIKTNNLDGMVVASCSPKLHLLTFRAVAERAGLNKYNYVHANIREQSSWAHSDNKAGATEKAILQVKSAIAKVLLAQPLTSFRIPSDKTVAVIGAGVAGLRAAIELADMGCPVKLIEKNHFIGGRVSQWDTLFTTDETGKEVITKLYKDILARDKIDLITGAELISCTGSIGNFKLSVRKVPRYIKARCEPGNLQKAINVCPVEVPDDFNFNITTRKAIYHNFPAEFPQAPVLDIKNCTHCGECEKICDSVDFSQEEEILEIIAGSVLVATGFDPYEPGDGEFGYREIENVITLPQFKRLIDLNKDKLIYKGKHIKKIAYIYCVGSRQIDGDNKYCSRYCCTSSIHAALQVKKKFHDIDNFHFSRGIRTYGKQEILYAESLRSGDFYFQAYEDDPPVVLKENGSTVVRINDILTAKREISVSADLVVLVTGMVPRSENNVASVLKLPRGRDNFFNEIHMKLRPVETVIDGITICGASQGPKNISESVSSSLSAAAKSFSIVSIGELEIEPVVAKIDDKLCTWCGACAEACPFNAVSRQVIGNREIAVINNSVCKGCGMCLPVCEPDAIELITYSTAEIEKMIDALAGYP
jgi:heterodisulfide reductase subunit A